MWDPLWAFLLDVAPFRRLVRAAVDHGVQEESRAARKVIEELREHQRRELLRRDERIAVLQRQVSDLRRQAEERRAFAAPLREEVLLREDYQATEVERDELTEVDLFTCLGCSSIWQVNTRPDDTRSVLRPHGSGCDECRDHPFERIRTGPAGVVVEPASPVDAPIPFSADLELPEDHTARMRITSKFVADLIEGGLESAVAKGVVREAGEYARNALWPADRCTTLSAIANGLAPIPNSVKTGIRWIATGIVGVPELVAETIAEVATRTLVEPIPLRSLAQAIRVVGVMSCAAENQLARCQCLRDFATKDLTEPQLSHALEEALTNATEPPADSALNVLTLADVMTEEPRGELRELLVTAPPREPPEPVPPEPEPDLDRPHLKDIRTPGGM